MLSFCMNREHHSRRFTLPSPASFSQKLFNIQLLTLNQSSSLPHYFPSPLKSFRINTCKSVTKQTTLTVSRINTYEKHRGEGVLLPFWFTLLAPSFEGSAAEGNSPLYSSPLFSNSCTLFCAPKNQISILIKNFHTLCAKHPGGGRGSGAILEEKLQFPERFSRRPFRRVGGQRHQSGQSPAASPDKQAIAPLPESPLRFLCTQTRLRHSTLSGRPCPHAKNSGAAISSSIPRWSCLSA
jgi:hypothetical protein